MAAATPSQGSDPNPRAPALATKSMVGRASGWVDETCRAAICGRQATRALADWTKIFRLSEPEFQLLWQLRDVGSEGLDQTTLARRLALSPAQVSAIVERLRHGGWIDRFAVPGDRRRQFWLLASRARTLLATVVVDEGQHTVPLTTNRPRGAATGGEEKAA